MCFFRCGEYFLAWQWVRVRSLLSEILDPLSKDPDLQTAVQGELKVQCYESFRLLGFASALAAASSGGIRPSSSVRRLLAGRAASSTVYKERRSVRGENSLWSFNWCLPVAASWCSAKSRGRGSRRRRSAEHNLLVREKNRMLRALRWMNGTGNSSSQLSLQQRSVISEVWTRQLPWGQTWKLLFRHVQ